MPQAKPTAGVGLPPMFDDLAEEVAVRLDRAGQDHEVHLAVGVGRRGLERDRRGIGGRVQHGIVQRGLEHVDFHLLVGLEITLVLALPDLV